ncbi:MAG: PIN domain-containing protein [Bacteroidetes bacterium]|nr:PIN domain-containing protein [Bacteroidota bacterium]
MDNCSFNRPYDDLSLLKNYLEAEAKTYIQKEILEKKYELAWSYILDYEVFFNPFSDRKRQIQKWKNIAIIDISESEKVIAMANEIMNKNIKPKDSLHLACAIEAECEYFITTDWKLLNKPIENIVVIDPIDFAKIMEVYK